MPLIHYYNFLRSPSHQTNKTRLISTIAQCFLNDSGQCQQAGGGGGAGRLNISATLDVSNPMLFVGILVMLVNPASGTHGGVHMGRGLASCILDIQENIFGCDIMAVLLDTGKKTVLHKVKESLGNIGYLEAFINTDNKKENIAAAGERFLIKLYWVHQRAALNALMYKLYGRAIRKCKLSWEFMLKTLPPTTEADRQHSFRISAWFLMVVRAIGKACEHIQIGLFCTALCLSCNGQSSSNRNPHDESAEA